MSGPVLETRGLTIRFGGLTAVDDVSVQVRKGEIFSIIGPNGAGKTTVFNAITGIYDATEGGILFQGREVARPVTRRTRAGIAAAALLTGVFLVGLVFSEGIWQTGVIDNYRGPSKPFPALKAAADGLGYPFVWKEGEPRIVWTLALFLFGAAIGGGGMFVVWRRSRRTPDYIAACGIARTFQNIRLFAEMTVLENVQVSVETKSRFRIWGIALRLPSAKREEERTARKAMEVLGFVGLADKQQEIAKNLAYGDQRRLEIARALALEPELLLVDEPAAGMNPAETGALMQLIRKIRDRGITVLVIEHHMRLVMGISDRIAVLDYGHKIAEGTPDEIRADPKVIEAYLGKEDVE